MIDRKTTKKEFEVTEMEARMIENLIKRERERWKVEDGMIALGGMIPAMFGLAPRVCEDPTIHLTAEQMKAMVTDMPQSFIAVSTNPDREPE